MRVLYSGECSKTLEGRFKVHLQMLIYKVGDFWSRFVEGEADDECGVQVEGVLGK